MHDGDQKITCAMFYASHFFKCDLEKIIIELWSGGRKFSSMMCRFLYIPRDT
jgi:hypothetical protein